MSKSVVKTSTQQSIIDTRQRLSSFRIVEDFILVWLDQTIDESNDDTRNSISQLQCIVNFIYPFIDSNQCIDFITDTTNEKVFLIIDGSLAQQLLPLIENIIQIESIYILCNDKVVHEQWTKEHQKVKGVFTQIQLICEMLKTDVRQSESPLAPISIIPTASSTNMNELDQSFMYSQLLKEILIDLPHDDNDKKELINFCRQQYAHNDRELHIIDEFEQKYDCPSPVWWYTRECFTYSMLNKALRTQDLEIIIKMGFFVRDLHRQITRLHSESNIKHSFVVYRGQGMSNDEFAKLKKSKGCLLSFNNFLSTSVKK
jgi:hypothetical protein